MSEATLSLLEAFQWRHAVRSYAGGVFTPALEASLNSAVEKGNSVPTPFSTPAQLKTIHPDAASSSSVANQSGWIIPVIPDSTPKDVEEIAKIDASVRGQVALMELSRHQIGTIFLGGYNKRQAGELFPGFIGVAAIAYGIGETSQLWFRNKIARFISQSDRRKPIHELFWDAANGRPYTEDTAGDLLPFLHAVQSSPSAINRQPWKFTVDEKTIHVFKTSNDGIASIDIGIAIGSIVALAVEDNHRPVFSVGSPAPPAVLGGTYVCSLTFRD
jgi:nitroreductase